MSDPSISPDGWAGPAAFFTSAAAFLAAMLRRGPKKEELHGLRNKMQATDLKVAVLESRYAEIDRRLGNIEAKLDRALER